MFDLDTSAYHTNCKATLGPINSRIFRTFTAIISFYYHFYVCLCFLLASSNDAPFFKSSMQLSSPLVKSFVFASTLSKCSTGTITTVADQYSMKYKYLPPLMSAITRSPSRTVTPPDTTIVCPTESITVNGFAP